MHKNPSIVSNVEESVLSNTDTYNIAENNFMVAATVDRFGEAKMDPRYV